MRKNVSVGNVDTVIPAKKRIRLNTFRRAFSVPSDAMIQNMSM